MITYKIATTADEIQKAYDLRREVFVDEQGVPDDLEIDEHDVGATHLVVLGENGDVIGTGRIVVERDLARGKIGRIAVDKKHRRKGIATEIVRRLEEEAKKNKLREAYLHAQIYIAGLYGALGYQKRGEEFEDAGIMHIEMYKIL